MKQCRHCLIYKLYADFNVTTRNKDGLVSYCKPCQSIRSRQYYLEYRRHGKHKTPSPCERFWEKVNILDIDECWLWKASRTFFGYGQLHYHGKPERAHRLAWIFTHGDIPEGMHVLHKCDTPACCNISHLFLGTHQENVNDMIIKERNAHGDSFVNSKLTTIQVLKIRELHSSGLYSTTEIGKMFFVSRQNVNDIVKRRSWKHI